MGHGSLDLLAWRRETAATYAAVRAEPDPVAAHALWRRRRDALFATSSQSPLAAGDARRRDGLPVPPYDPAFRLVLPLEPAGRERRDVATGTDGMVPFERVGLVTLPGLGTLDVWWLATYGGGIFVPVKDASAGQTSYGGGRYLLDTVKGADLGDVEGRLVVDLNFLYHPSCAYDAAWACPLAPAGNVLAGAVPVGEQLPG